MSTPNQTTKALRIVDANYNRAMEGLRVVEQFARFCLDDRHLTEQCKQLRHDLASAMAPFSAEQLHAVRETELDVGKDVGPQAESPRGEAADLLEANWKRVEQSLRCLEQYAALIHESAAGRLQPLRYRSYELEKAMTATIFGRRCLADRTLYVLLDGAGSVDEFALRVQRLLSAGVPILQLRDKSLSDRQLIGRARLMREKTRRAHALFIMNDRPDLALLADADGVHVGQEELPVRDVRRLVGPQMLIGVSTHSIEQARQAVLDGANYLGVGPTFPSRTKQFDQFPGVDLLRQVCRAIRLPAFAIGGITRENLHEVLGAGFDRVAVGQAVSGAADPGAAARELLCLLSEHSSN